MARTWAMHGHRNDHQPGTYLHVETHRDIVAMYGDDEIVALTVTEDPDGTYLGWLPTGDTDLVMVQWHTIFSMQFAYGPQAEVERGNGEVVRVSITETDPADAATLPGHWAMYAHRSDQTGHYRHITEKQSRTARYSTTVPIHPVTVTLDPDGTYLGWLPTGTNTPNRILPDHLFETQFPYGHESAEAAGRGRAIRLTVTPGHPSPKDTEAAGNR